MEKQHKFSIWYFLLVFFALMFLQRYFFLSHVQDITYSEFRKLVQANKVNELEKVAQLLLEKEVIGGDEFRNLIS